MNDLELAISVALEAHEDVESYDASYYETQLVRAVENVLAPLGWDRTEIQRGIAETRETELAAFTESERF